MSRERPLSGPAAQRLEVVLGALGDHARAPRPFEEIEVLDTTPSRPARRARPWVVASVAVAAVVAVVAGLWWSATGDGARPAASHPPAPQATTSPAPTSTSTSEASITTTAPAGEPFGTATVAPLPVAPGERFTVTPSAPVARTCGDYAAVYRSAGGTLDQVAEAAPIGHPWQLSDADVPFTVPGGGCDDVTSDIPTSYDLPDAVSPGVYVVCLGPTPSEPSCGTLHVTAASSGDATTLRLLTFPITYGGQAFMRATIVVRDACVLRAGPSDDQPLAVAWPPGFRTVGDHIESPDGTVVIRPGDTVDAGGGFFALDPIPDPTFEDCVADIDHRDTDGLMVIGEIIDVRPASTSGPP